MRRQTFINDIGHECRPRLLDNRRDLIATRSGPSKCPAFRGKRQSIGNAQNWIAVLPLFSLRGSRGRPVVAVGTAHLLPFIKVPPAIGTPPCLAVASRTLPYSYEIPFLESAAVAGHIPFFDRILDQPLSLAAAGKTFLGPGRLAIMGRVNVQASGGPDGTIGANASGYRYSCMAAECGD